MTRRRQNQSTLGVEELILIGLAMILSAISFWQTWGGYEQLFGGVAIGVSFVLTILLLFITYKIWEHKKENKPTTALSIFYFMLAIFSITGNFNQIYTTFLKTDIYREELREVKNDFTDLENTINENLNYKYPKNISQQIESKKKQLSQQIKDEANPGIGSKAQMIISDIERLLGQKLTFLTAKNNDYNDLARRMEEQIDNLLFNLSPDEKKLKSDIHSATLKWHKEVDNLLGMSSDIIDNSTPQVIELALSDYNKIGNQANSTLGTDNIGFENKKSEVNEVGKMGYSFKHAISNIGVYSIGVLFACLFLDLAILIMIHLTTNNQGNNTIYYRGPRRYTPSNNSN